MNEILIQAAILDGTAAAAVAVFAALLLVGLLASFLILPFVAGAKEAKETKEREQFQVEHQKWVKENMRLPYQIDAYGLAYFLLCKAIITQTQIRNKEGKYDLNVEQMILENKTLTDSQTSKNHPSSKITLSRPESYQSDDAVLIKIETETLEKYQKEYLDQEKFISGATEGTTMSAVLAEGKLIGLFGFQGAKNSDIFEQVIHDGLLEIDITSEEKPIETPPRPPEMKKQTGITVGTGYDKLSQNLPVSRKSDSTSSDDLTPYIVAGLANALFLDSLSND